MTPQKINRFDILNPRFKKEFEALPLAIRTLAKKQFGLMGTNFNHPSLGIKLHDKKRKIWEARITIHYRFTFTIDGDVAKLRRIGDHSIYRNP
jgi:mRNA-degrading endonuclease RelE of RelBE toxin-antitoxin system